jgi:dipeptidyl-peptidase-4
MKKRIAYLLMGFILTGMAQQKDLTIEDAVMGFAKGLYPANLSNLQWVEQSSHYVFNKDNALLFTDARTGKEVKSLALEVLKQHYPELKRLPAMVSVTPSELRFRLGNSYHIFDHIRMQPSGQVTVPENAGAPDYHKATRNVAYTMSNNLYIATKTSEKLPVTQYTDENIVSGQAIHRSEFGITKGTFWSPSGNFLAFYQKDESNVTSYPLVDVTTNPASLKSIKYPMAGQGSEFARIGIYDVANGKTSYLEIDTSDEHYLTNLTWSPDERYIFLAEVNRDQNHVWMNAYDRTTGKKIRTLFEESDERWTEPETGPMFLPESTTEFLWLSERDGFMNLYLYKTDGTLVKQLTHFKWVVKEVLGFDGKGTHVYLSGTGVDPRDTHLFKVNIRSGKATKLTVETGTHRGQLSGDGMYLLDNFSSITTPRKINLLTTRNGKVQNVFTAKNPLEEYTVGMTDFITLKAEDGTDLYGKIIKPHDFDPEKKYPVLVYVYGGPHAQLVTNSWGAGSSLWMPVFASNEDYIVFTLDNRGSAHRGFEFESVIHRRLGDVEIEDQLTGIGYLRGLPFVDSSRIAVNGWSYGGFMTTSLMLRHPGIFTTAVAGGPVTDWKYYEVMYGERYMDRPQDNELGYKKSRVHNYIRNLKGKMLIIHGSIDPVVVPQHSMTLLKEAVKQKIPIDFFTYPMHEHNVRGIDRVHLIEKMTDYILENNK